MELLSILATKPSVSDYSGGTNPVLIYLFFGGIFFLIGLSIFFAIYKRLNTAKFNGHLSAAGITGEELGMLKSFIKRFNIKEPLEVVTNQGQFNRFMDRIAHHYEYTRLSEEAMIREVQIFDRIRRKLGFTDTMKGNRCENSRAIPVDFPLKVTFTDKNTHESFTFHSKVLANYDFFLGIRPPENSLSKEVFDSKRPPIHVEFDLEEGSHQSFDSCYLRSVNYPETMWCLQHSSSLTTAAVEQRLEISASLMVAHDEEEGEVTEVDGRLVDLTNRGCCFQSGEELEKLPVGTGVLVNFDVNEEPFVCRGSIDGVQQIEQTKLYRMTFNGLNEEEQKLLVRFAHQEKKNSKSGA